MRKFSLKAALACGAVIGLSAMARGQVVNGDFEQGTAGASGTDTLATAWTMSPAPNTVGGTLNYTNNGQRCQFATPTPSGGTWSFWEQTFCQYGTASQVVATGIVPGNTYYMSDEQAFEGPGTTGQGFNGILAANQSAGTPNNGENGGNGYSYLGFIWLNNHGASVGSLNPDGLSVETMIPAGTVTTANHVYGYYSAAGVAPAGAAGIELVIGWANGGTDGNTGGQSVFATDVGLAPEPASLGLLGMGALALLGRRSRTA